MNEGDTLYSDLTIETAQPRTDGRGTAVRLRSIVYAAGDGRDCTDEDDRAVLDWVFTGLVL